MCKAAIKKEAERMQEKFEKLPFPEIFGRTNRDKWVDAKLVEVIRAVERMTADS